MDAGLASHSDAFNVVPVDSQVGAQDGDGDSSLHGPKTRNDLRQETRRRGRGLEKIVRT